MNGFAKGIRSGGRVKQGDVIGYIGSTGLATGPHLHYEFRLDGVHRNPLTYKTPKAGSIDEQFKTEFAQQTNRWLAELNGISSEYQLAKARSARLNTQVL
jgi:murein DD-endopeptidase MepM/ murein hydrolase activator NlpD